MNYYDPGEQRAAKVNLLFETIAGRYDRLNDLMSFGAHRRWKRRVVELAAVRAGDQALDLCCGTGDIAFGLAARGAEVTGLDFSEAMLRIAEERTRSKAIAGQSAGKNQPRFLRGDATRIPFPEASFDIVTIGFGLRNLTRWDAGLSEMARVARPGARLVVLEFGKPKNALWRAIYFAYLCCFVPLLGLTFCGNASAYSYILDSLKHYPAQIGVAAKMRELGLENVRITNFLFGAMSIQSGVKPPAR